MVTVIPYGMKTQASGLAQQNSGGNAYIGNLGMQTLGQSIGGAFEKITGTDEESIRKAEQQELNRNKFEQQIEQREQERFLQSEKISAFAKISDLDIDVGAEAETLKSKIGAGANGYSDLFSQSLDKKIGTFTKSLSFHQKQFLEPQIAEFKNRYIANAKSYERNERINNDIANVQKVQKSMLDKVNYTPESANFAITQNRMMIETLGVNPDIARKLTEEYEEQVQELQMTREMELDPKKFLSKFEPKGSYNNDVSDFENSIDEILKTEGGYVAKDGRSNASAIYGINEKYNPDLYKRIKKLYDAGRTDEAVELAKDGYKDRYWDAINADSLPDNLRHISFDTAINQGVDVANRIIKQSNGDLDKFVELRIEEYKKLNQPENIKGWINRVNDRVAETKAQSDAGTQEQQPTMLERKAIGAAQSLVEKIQNKTVAQIKILMQDGEITANEVEQSGIFTGDPKSLLSIKKMQTTVEKAKETAQIKIDKEKKRLMAQQKADVATYVMNKPENIGKPYNPQAIYDEQEQMGVPPTQRKVLPNDAAEKFSVQLQNIRSLDDLISWSEAIETVATPKFTPNAYKQMERDYNLPREFKALISLDPYEDQEELRAMFSVLSSSKADFNEIVNVAIDANSDTKSEFYNAFNVMISPINDIQRMQGDAGEGIVDTQSKLKVLAQANYVRTKNTTTAINFARNAYLKKYHNDGDELSEYDGNPILLPVNQVKDLQQAKGFLDVHKENIADEIFYVSDINDKIINDSTKEQIVDTAYYGLSPNGDGLFMFSENGLLLLNKNKQPIEVKFKDMNNYTLPRKPFSDSQSFLPKG